jgi:dienelactone hydrolase
MKPFRLSRRRLLVASLAAGSFPAVLPAAEGGAGKEVAWLADIQRPPKQLPEDAPRLSPLLVDASGRPISTLSAWKARRGQIRRWWLDFLKPLGTERQGPPAFRVLAEERPEGAVRQLIRYEVEPGEPCEAYLLKPAKPGPRCPAAVVLHSTVDQTIRPPAGVAGRPETAFGLKLAGLGYVTLCPRNFLWATDGKDFDGQQVERFSRRHPGCKGMAKMLYDAQVALDILAGMPEVDANRLGALGHSLGAKEVLYLAALDERVKVAVSSEGGIGTAFSNWDAPWYLGPEIRQKTFGHEHHELLALVAPRAFLLLGGDSADGQRSWPFIQAVLPVYKLYGPPDQPAVGARYPARVGLLNHQKGHSVPPEAERAIYEWLRAYC